MSRRAPNPGNRAWPTRLAAAALVLALGVLAWRYGVRDHLIPRNFGVVTPGHVYRSASLTPAATRRVVEDHGIRTIIDLGGFDKLPTQERVAQRTAEALGVERHTLWLEGDGTGDPNRYVEALRILADPAKHPVLIHCSAGAERTSGLVMLYREAFEGRPLDETYPESFGYHHRTHRNPRLKNYLDRWSDRIIAACRDGSRIDTAGEPLGGDYYNQPVAGPAPAGALAVGDAGGTVDGKPAPAAANGN